MRRLLVLSLLLLAVFTHRNPIPALLVQVTRPLTAVVGKTHEEHVLSRTEYENIKAGVCVLPGGRPKGLPLVKVPELKSVLRFLRETASPVLAFFVLFYFVAASFGDDNFANVSVSGRARGGWEGGVGSAPYVRGLHFCGTPQILTCARLLARTCALLRTRRRSSLGVLRCVLLSVSS